MTNHGGDIYSVMERRGFPQSALIDFSASINPLGTPRNVILEIKKCLKNLIHYPDMNATRLREKLGNAYDIDPKSILCGNGCTELIHLVPRTMGFHKVMIVQPTFSDYERACRIARPECSVMYHILERKRNFDVEPQSLIDDAATERVEAVFLCNPNNPTGRLIDHDMLLDIAQEMRKRQIYLIVDESFMDFSVGRSVAHAVEKNPYLMVLKSLTKFYALAGLRLGYGIFPMHIAAMLRENKEPWTVNTLAQAAGVVALDENDYRERTKKLMSRQRGVFERGFRALGIEYVPSLANYFLLYIPDAPKIAEQLESKGILVRGCANFKGLDHRYLRVAVKSPKDNRSLLTSLKECLV
ncbi:MAG TPA: threonine-phosphate decarboxylase CobD [Syntrophorhabdaceae bacterium]|nr:threonine-phosphate decarboxylase CobD [Syntrophorhabdaceae bacterium]